MQAPASFALGKETVPRGMVEEDLRLMRKEHPDAVACIESVSELVEVLVNVLEADRLHNGECRGPDSRSPRLPTMDLVQEISKYNRSRTAAKNGDPRPREALSLCGVIALAALQGSHMLDFPLQSTRSSNAAAAGWFQLLGHITETLHKTRSDLRKPRVHCSPALHPLVRRLGGEVCSEPVAGCIAVTPSLLRPKRGGSNESTTFCRVQATRSLPSGDRCLVHFIFYPDSYDAWVPVTQLVDPPAAPYSRARQISQQPHAQKAVSEAFLEDSLKFNEFCNPEDYVRLEQDQQVAPGDWVAVKCDRAGLEQPAKSDDLDSAALGSSKRKAEPIAEQTRKRPKLNGNPDARSPENMVDGDSFVSASTPFADQTGPQAPAEAPNLRLFAGGVPRFDDKVNDKPLVPASAASVDRLHSQDACFNTGPFAGGRRQSGLEGRVVQPKEGDSSERRWSSIRLQEDAAGGEPKPREDTPSSVGVKNEAVMLFEKRMQNDNAQNGSDAKGHLQQAENNTNSARVENSSGNVEGGPVVFPPWFVDVEMSAVEKAAFPSATSHTYLTIRNNTINLCLERGQQYTSVHDVVRAGQGDCSFVADVFSFLERHSIINRGAAHNFKQPPPTISPFAEPGILYVDTPAGLRAASDVRPFSREEKLKLIDAVDEQMTKRQSSSHQDPMVDWELVAQQVRRSALECASWFKDADFDASDPVTSLSPGHSTPAPGDDAVLTPFSDSKNSAMATLAFLSAVAPPEEVAKCAAAALEALVDHCKSDGDGTPQDGHNKAAAASMDVFRSNAERLAGLEEDYLQGLARQATAKLLEMAQVELDAFERIENEVAQQREILQNERLQVARVENELRERVLTKQG
ncbi:SWI/SNF and RSC complexes subunit ssr2 [Diplonema papillatum]|nr:SWI/SNF and RSC complexes subunit ssr2 [Diplonema papillatum]